MQCVFPPSFQVFDLLHHHLFHPNTYFCFLYLLVSLARVFPETLMLGMEIRVKVSDFVVDRIKGLREEKKDVPGGYQNIACIRTNAMKYLPNFFEKGQVRYVL